RGRGGGGGGGGVRGGGGGGGRGGGEGGAGGGGAGGGGGRGVRACRVAVWTSTQYGQVLAAETSAATASLAARVTVPEASSDSASISQHAAMTGGTGEWRITGGASMPKSRSSPAYTSATSPRAARGRTGATWRTCASAPGAVIRLSVLPTAASSVAQQGRDQDRKSTRLNSSHVKISYAVFCLKKKKIA